MAFYTVANRYNHVEIIIFDLAIDFSSAFFLNCRKFCDSWDSIIQFFFQSVVDVLANRLDIQLCLAILALIDDDLVVQVDLFHRFMGYRKLLVAKIIHLLLRS